MEIFSNQTNIFRSEISKWDAENDTDDKKQQVIWEIPNASVLKWGQMQFLVFENIFLISCKQNFFLQKIFCTWLHFESERRTHNWLAACVSRKEEHKAKI